MKHTLLIIGDESFAQMMKNLSNYRYTNLMIDFITVSRKWPLPFPSVWKKGLEWGINEFQQENEAFLAEIQSYNFLKDDRKKIIVISSCHDHLAYNLLGFPKSLKVPIYNMKLDQLLLCLVQFT